MTIVGYTYKIKSNFDENLYKPVKRSHASVLTILSVISWS